MFSPKTHSSIRDRIPDDLSNIVIKYFLAKNRMWKSVAKAGEFETCLDFQWDLIRDRKHSFESSTFFEYACRGGHDELIRDLITRGFTNWDMGLYGACRGGHMEIAEIMISHGARDWDFCLSGACRGGNIKIVNLILSNHNRNITSINYGLYGACRGGHNDVIERMISCGAADWSLGLSGACKGGHKEIAEDMIRRGATDLNWGLEGACFKNRKELAKLMISRGATKCSNCKRTSHEHTDPI